LFPQHAVTLLILCAIVLHGGAHLALPQWSSLIGDIVSPRKRGRFFGVRTQIMTGLTFVGLLAGGFALYVFSERDQTAYGFALLFTVAAIARLVSVYHLGQMHDPGGHVEPLNLSLRPKTWQRIRRSNAVRFSMFIAFIYFGTWISSPFFTVYLLRDLEFNYLEFTIAIGTAVLAQLLTMSQWGRISDVFGNRRVLEVSCVAIPIVPILWLISTNFYYIVAIQLISGFVWAGFSLCAGNFVYDLIRPAQRATYLAVHNVLSNFGIFAGSLIGGLLGSMMPSVVALGGFDWTWASPLYGIFLLSALLRGLAIVVFLPKIQEVRNVRPISARQVIFRAAHIHALAGLIFDMIGARPRK
jgi:MFS family permease